VEPVAFITTGVEDDLIVSFAVQEPTEPTEIENRDGRFRCVGL
jgi:hypothetical protein